MLRSKIASLGLLSLSAGSVALSAGTALAVNVAFPDVNPNVRAAGTTTFGNVDRANNLNDGSNGDSEPGSMFQIPNGSRGFGYDLGGIATIESLDLSQYTATPIGARSRLQNVMVHTSGGDFPFTLPDQDDVTMTFPGPVTTSFVLVETLSQHPGQDAQIGIDELAVNSASGVVATGPVNLALGRTETRPGGGWNNQNGSRTDGVLFGANTDLSTSAFNSSPTAPGNSLDIDLGSSQTVGGLGLAEHDFGGAGGRQLIADMTVLVDDDPAFGSPETRSLLLENIPYQQVEFAPATGQFVRLTFQSQHPNPDANVGFTEVQLFAPIPEPAGLALAALAALPALARRRRA